MTAPPSTSERRDPVLTENLAASLVVSTATDANAVGQSLRRLREARGWTTADVSQRLKFSERQIAALEAEAWPQLPQGLALRGLIRNYAQMLGTDPQALLTALEPQLGVAGTQRTSLGSEAASKLMSQDPARTARWGWLAALCILTAVAGAIAVTTFGWPGAWFGKQS